VSGPASARRAAAAGRRHGLGRCGEARTGALARERAGQFEYWHVSPVDLDDIPRAARDGAASWASPAIAYARHSRPPRLLRHFGAPRTRQRRRGLDAKKLASRRSAETLSAMSRPDGRDRHTGFGELLAQSSSGLGNHVSRGLERAISSASLVRASRRRRRRSNIDTGEGPTFGSRRKAAHGDAKKTLRAGSAIAPRYGPRRDERTHGALPHRFAGRVLAFGRDPSSSRDCNAMAGATQTLQINPSELSSARRTR